MAGSDPEPDIAELFCHYNALYFQDTLGACAVTWAEEPLPYGDTSGCEYYPGGGGCIVLLSRSLYEVHTYSDLKNVLLHEMIHAYVCIKDNNTNHSNHGVNFQKLMNTINSSPVPDRHRPLGGYNIITLHDIRKKCYQYECDGCGDFVRSTKIRGPSHDDCIERMGANSSCPNSACQWHRHKKRCSGSYHRVGKSAPGCAEPGGSVASVEETLDERKAAKSASGSWHAKHTSNKPGTSNKHELEDAPAEFRHPTDDAIDKSGLGSSSGDRSNKKIKLSKDVCFGNLTGTTVQEAPKRSRPDTAKRNQECSRRKKRKTSKWDRSYSIIVERLNYYCVDDSDEDEVPLINKRTEMRKRQRLLENSQAPEPNNGRKDVCVESCSQGPGDKNISESEPASQVEERSLPDHLVRDRVAAPGQTGDGTLVSPIVGEIVDIPDG
ncbi:Zinc finger RAD18 domain-containing protein [Hordeum vulgare]|uniref:SprT-like domain-containing protein n=1 Tax=Hordeum vulgare subsp. vulgare TaxID=112509 RepID=A0A8I6XJL9_HORVV|nr:DNA-dependent metalloprotease dvc-1-like [Hordeum vulgare subsp. vulgare]KAE8770925.1 Zinc finger RAD18 domain-containing protein [Hordeum vulgare]KAI4993366.1 hypothetical protein ZWY2020_007679 [Hordeum vulgare]